MPQPTTYAFFDEVVPGQGAAYWGAKGAWLHWLATQGERVPAGFVVPVQELDLVAEGEPEAVERLRAAWARLAARLPQSVWAVRASPVESQPGVLPTELDVDSFDQVRDALRALRDCARQEQTACAGVVQARVRPGPEGWAAAVFTRDPTRGLPGVVGEWSRAGEGRDVVEGKRRLPSVTQGPGSLRERLPAHFALLESTAQRLEQCAGRVLELELLHDGEQLWVLQARSVARQAAAAVRLAIERADGAALGLDLRMADAQGLWVERAASRHSALAQGLAASPGVASGRVALDSHTATRLADAGQQVLLVRHHAEPGDVPGMRAAQGVLTATGGLTCHAAVMARGLQRPAVVGCEALRIGSEELRVGGQVVPASEWLSIDGFDGSIYPGVVERVRVPSGGGALVRLLRQLQRRRKAQLWLLDPPPSVWAQVASWGPDGVLLSSVDAGEDVAPLPTWIPGEPGQVQRPASGEAPRPVHHIESAPAEASWAPGAVHQVEVAPWSDALWVPSDTVIAVPTPLFLAWAFVLDPISNGNVQGVVSGW